jgi:hypothetical protein
MKRRPLTLLVMLVLLAGCSTGAQRQSQAIRENDGASGQQLRACAEAVYNSPAFDPIRPKLPMDVRKATIEQQTDSSMATDEQIAAVLDTHPRLQACRQTYLDRESETTPSRVPIISAFLAKSESSLIDVVQRKKSWGEHVRYVKEAFPQFERQLIAENQRIQAGLDQSQQAELSRRQAAAAAFGQYMQTQQMINAINRPVTTNCNRFGNNVNCVTR